MSLFFRIYDFVLLFDYCFETELYCVAWANHSPQLFGFNLPNTEITVTLPGFPKTFYFFNFKGLLIFKVAHRTMSFIMTFLFVYGIVLGLYFSPHFQFTHHFIRSFTWLLFSSSFFYTSYFSYSFLV